MEEKIQRLSEGMDFIEESEGTSSEPLSFSEVNEISISEEASAPSPYRVLGTARGCFAPINEFSRNRRLYSPELWPTVLQNEELKSRLASRAVFGCLGHADKLVDDRDIQEGKVSHIVTLLEVRNDQKTGKPYLYGELEILDTPAGRILEAMYKGGANLYVSSRAAGKLVPVPGQNYSLVKPDQYHVHTFDIVCRPGFLQAHPMFEATNESVSEAQVSKLSDNTVEIEKGKEVDHKEKKDYDEAPSREKAHEADTSIEELKSKIDKLAKIVEKVVDDVYEDPEETTEVQEEKKEEKKTDKKAAIPAFLTIMAESNISAEALSEIIDMIKGDISND